MLPGLGSATLAQLGVVDNAVLLKQRIIAKNLMNHPDIAPTIYAEILSHALYQPELILPANPNKPYVQFIARAGEDKHYTTLLQVQGSCSGYFEIINMHFIDDAARDRCEKRAQRMKKEAKVEGRMTPLIAYWNKR
ncbi:MAG: hypothetical protein FWD06_00585 [Oscillospiraceae bacterium]|nr:hypothetical protein [Oscillospiraceae bacterium]